MSWEDPFFFTIIDLEKFIENKYATILNIKNSSQSLSVIEEELNQIIEEGGIQKIAELMFDSMNEEFEIPKYYQFIEAFEFYSKKSKEKYIAQTVGHNMIFQVNNDFFEMHTYEGKIAELKHFIETKSYDEIYTQTNEHIWGEIYIDAGIEKEKFIPLMLSEWESFWEELYYRIKNEIGHTNHLDKLRDRSWRELNTFINLYNDSGNIIELAYDFDEMRLYPMAVITMMNIFNADVCYDEYCEYEFDSSDEWKSICVDENLLSPIFYIKPYDK